MKVSLLSIDDCPNRQVAEARAREALRLTGRADLAVEHVLVSSEQEARDLRFVGSPTVLIDGEDPFLDDEPRPFGLTCRVYRSNGVLAGAPSVEELVSAISARV